MNSPCLRAKGIRTSKCVCGYFTGQIRRKKFMHSSSQVLCKIKTYENRHVTLDYAIHSQHIKDPNASPIVICHGLFGSKINWRSLGRRINTMSGRKVITYDCVNHGDSSHHDEMSYNDLAHDLIALLNQLDISKVLLIGHSMGGKTVMTSALTYPDRVEKIISVDAAPTISKSSGEVLRYLNAMSGMDMSKMKTKQAIEEELHKVVKSRSVLMFLMQNLKPLDDGFYWRINLKAMAKNYHYTHAFPVFKDGVQFDKPALFVGGERSYYITEEEYPEIIRLFPLATIKHIPAAGHWVHSDQPNAFLESIASYIKV
ncbi:protein ABHD11-like isoform X3 [Hydractinia symbiolongicarpus]|uniref:protein ABHD11-like isoform X3 n=1 Tax=Hydractinia symbiolongicarpus TaxID=13093 RepID=UPI00254C36E4|nr:protein ABHD11-like isoform X3 [Hydractinia symbiolongicarpus]